MPPPDTVSVPLFQLPPATKSPLVVTVATPTWPVNINVAFNALVLAPPMVTLLE